MVVDLKPDGCNIRQWIEFYVPGPEFAVMEMIYDNSTQWINSLPKGKKFPYRHSVRLGYHSGTCSMRERNDHLQDIYNINTSIPERQGREMEPSYREYPVKYTDSKQCPLHYTQFFACFSSKNVLVAYLNLHVTGDIASISMILGHWEHQKKAGIMVNLIEAAVKFCIKNKIPYLAYHLSNSGTEGLQFFKKSLGFKPIQL
jgi:hypothetical protein